MDYLTALRWLLTLPDFERTGEFADRPDVAPTRALLAALGDPQLGRPTLHIAGSKGKGSTAVMAEAVLRAAGRRTGCYVSPHLHRYTERVRIDGQPIDREAFAAALTFVHDAMPAVEAQFTGRALLAFDVLTAAACVAFREAEVDAQVVEVGLGGSLDSTNVFDATEVVAITPISLEHTAILGSTIPEIAAQKAGIITPGSVVVVAPQRESALAVVRAVAAERDARIVEVAAACQLARTSANADGQEFRLRTPRETYTAKLPLLGRHQLDNAATAVVAAEELAERAGFAVTPAQVRSALAAVAWQGRMEVLRRRPLVIADGAHNGDSVKRMVAALHDHFGLKSATLLFGTLAGKDVEAMAIAAAPIAAETFVAAWPSARAADAREVAAIWRHQDVIATAFPAVGDAMEAAEAHAGERGCVLAFGSLAFVAAVREYVLGIESDMIMLSAPPDPAGAAPAGEQRDA